MDKQSLLEYLEIVLDLEKHRLLQMHLKSAMTERVESLSKTTLKEPQKRTVRYPESPLGFIEIFGPIMLGAGWLILLAAGVPAILSHSGVVFWGITLLYTVPLVIYAARRASQNKKIFEQEVSEYIQEKKRCEEEYKKEMYRFNQEQAYRKRRLMLWEQLRNEVRDRLAVTEELLNRVYAKNVIALPYRSLPAVASIYGYLSIGRCHTLERNGSDEGAYNILEKESVANVIILQLERILQNVEGIRHNQDTLHTILRDNNDKMDKLMDSSDRMMGQLVKMQTSNAELSDQLKMVRDTSAIAAYHAERAAKEASYARWSR